MADLSETLIFAQPSNKRHPISIMEELKSILRHFDINRSEFIAKSTISEEVIGKCFEPCAKDILCGGYILVNGMFKIDIRSIELYYHEEDGGIIDPIMYHTNLNMKNSTIFKRMNELPYFEFGSLNLHTSGIDVTFENPDEHYRASFLIREYRILTIDQELSNTDVPFDKHSTHLFDDMLYLGVPTDKPLDLRWCKDDSYKDCEIEELPRINVAQYVFTNGKYEKEPVDENKLKELGDEAFKYSGKWYLKCQRKWQFRRK